MNHPDKISSGAANEQWASITRKHKLLYVCVMAYGHTYVSRCACCIRESMYIAISFCVPDGNTVYTVRNKVPDPAVSYTEVAWNTREACSRNVRGSTDLYVYDDAADKCREYATVIAEQDLIDANGFIAFYPIVGSGPGMCFFSNTRTFYILYYLY